VKSPETGVETRPGMLRRVADTVLLIVAIAAAGLARADGHPPGAHQPACRVEREENVPARMRDGTILYADVYRPVSSERFPVILMRTQYGKDSAQVNPSRYQPPAWYAAHCYIVVIQDTRGTGASKGEFYEYARDRDDGYDTVQWAATLPGSDGRVGMYGSSYVGATQWLAATASPPALKAIVPTNTASDYYDGWTYEDGAFRLHFIENWMVVDLAWDAATSRGDWKTADRLTEEFKSITRWMSYRPYIDFPPFRAAGKDIAPYFFDAIRHPTYDEYWRRFSIQSRYDRVKVPVLAFEGWYDTFLNGGLKNFTGMQRSGGSAIARKNQRIVIGPWDHIGWGRAGSVESPRLRAIGEVADSSINELTIKWFDHFLKGVTNGVATGPQVDYFTLGENRWHTSSAWPLPQTRYETWYLASGGHAASIFGDGVLTTGRQGSQSLPDRFVYQPWDPVPSVGGHSCCDWRRGAMGQFDQSQKEVRPDILVYTSGKLSRPLTVTGPISLSLYASSSATDTDFTAELIDVYPDGTAVNLNNGILDVRYRDSLSNPTPIIPGKIYRYTIHIWPTSNLFAAGHRIRVEISSSDFPQFAPNPNTGDIFGTSTRWHSAEQLVYHDAEHPSAIVLPVIPAAVAGMGKDHAPAL
jgi:putative CocE/NonD family hydrolase